MNNKHFENLFRLSFIRPAPQELDYFDFEKRIDLYNEALKHDLDEDQIRLLAQLQNNQLLYRQTRLLKTIKNILVFFFTLTCISLAISFIYILFILTR